MKNFRDNPCPPINNDEFHPVGEEYGLHVDYKEFHIRPNFSTETDTDDSVNVCGMIFKTDPLTRELVLHRLLELETSSVGSNKSISQIGIRPGDILCKVMDPSHLKSI